MNKFTKGKRPSPSTISRLGWPIHKRIVDFDTAMDAVEFLYQLGYDIDGSFNDPKKITLFTEVPDSVYPTEQDMTVEEFKNFFANILTPTKKVK